MARRLSGAGDLTQMSSPGYYPGWGILLTPIWWITQNPQTVYRLAIVTVIILAMITLCPLALIAKRFGLANGQAITAAALTLSLPARTVNADYALAENLLALLVACTMLAAFRYWERATIVRAFILAIVAVACYLTHVRALIMLPAVAIWLILCVRKNWMASLAGLCSLVAGYFFVQQLVNLVTLPTMLGEIRQDDNILSHFSYLTLAHVVRIAMQQTWAQLAGSFGVIAIGAVFLVTLVWKDLRHRDIGPHAFAAMLFLAAFALSVFAWMTPPSGRFDIQVYTRYLDPFAMIVVLYGIAAVFTKTSRMITVAAGGFSLLVVLIVCLKYAPWSTPWGSMDGPANSAGVLAWANLRPNKPFQQPLIPGPDNGNAFWFWGSVSVIAGIFVITLLQRFAKVLSILLIVSFAVLSWYSNPSQSRDYPHAMNATLQAVESTAHMERGTLSIDFNLSCHAGKNYSNDAEFEKALNWSGFWFIPRPVTLVKSDTGESFRADVVISCQNWSQAQHLGAQGIRGSEFETSRLWVLPGKLQDKLRAAGMLE
jgi:hypothetical protein